MNDYYLIAFLDLDRDEQHDAREPYEIYLDRAAPPAEAVRAAANPPSADFTFGDENLSPGSTATPTPSQEPTASPSTTPTPPPCTGDCNHSGTVTIDEVMTLVNIALGNGRVPCAPGNPNENDTIEINEIVGAVQNAAEGCPGTR
jgi:hypothetical protein